MPGSLTEVALALLDAARQGNAEGVAQLLELVEASSTLGGVPALFVAADAALASAGEPLRLLHLAARADGGTHAMRPALVSDAHQGAVALLLNRMPGKEVDRKDRAGLNPVHNLLSLPLAAWQRLPRLGTLRFHALSHNTCWAVSRSCTTPASPVTPGLPSCCYGGELIQTLRLLMAWTRHFIWHALAVTSTLPRRYSTGKIHRPVMHACAQQTRTGGPRCTSRSCQGSVKKTRPPYSCSSATGSCISRTNNSYHRHARFLQGIFSMQSTLRGVMQCCWQPHGEWIEYWSCYCRRGHGESFTEHPRQHTFGCFS